MIKLTNLLKEGTIQLTPEERERVEHLLPHLIKTISGKDIPPSHEVPVADMEIVSADGTPMKVRISVANNTPDSEAYYNAGDRKNPTDNRIVIQQSVFAPYFKGLSGLDAKLYKITTGDENVGMDKLRGALKHELIHAKDPASNQHFLNEPYDSTKPEVYYKSWREFQTMTGQFFEAITTGVDRALEIEIPKDKILKSLDDILNFYAGKTKMLSQDTNDFIQGTGKRNIFQSLIKFADEIAGGGIRQPALDAYTQYIAAIKQYHPEAYNEFLKDLYKTIDQAKNKLNKLKEMKHINEVHRWQKLAGILTEDVPAEVPTPNAAVATNPTAEKDAEIGLKQALSVFKAGAASLTPSPKDGELDESLFSLAVSAPGLMQLLGKGVNLVSSVFQKDKQSGTAAGNALIHWGKELEEAYISGIGFALLKLFPSAYEGQDVHDESSALHDAAHVIFASFLLANIIHAGFEMAEAEKLVSKVIAGTHAATEMADVAGIASKIVAV